jgi:hypothetical protein
MEKTMPTIKTHVDESTYQKLVKMRRAAGLPSVSALFLDKCEVLTDAKEAGEIVRQALRRAKKKNGGSQFRLRDLFKNWQQFSKGARLRAGRLFFEKVSAAVDGIRPVRKSPSGQQIYAVQ